MKKLKQELEDRGLLYQNSNDDLFGKFDAGEGTFYCGFDPTADSLHLGNFIGFMVAVHLMRRGNKYIALTGGATGMIGDPGGKDSERNFLSEEDLSNNEKAISSQISSISNNLKEFTGEDFKYDFVNNKDFYTDMGYLDFLREVGKYITINNMVSKDTVKKRVEDPKQSISYTEFSYMLLQGYDFVRLFKESNVTLQIGGQDQWGNLVTGTELIRKKYDGDANVLTWPLITDATGRKFGKSEGNAIWVDKNKTSPYEIYQYFMNTSDDDISRYLKMLTLIETEEIDILVSKHMETPENREGQKLLAYKVVEIIHGTFDADISENISGFMFGKDNKISRLINLDGYELGSFQIELGGFKYNGENLFEVIVNAGLESSNSNARNAVKGNSISINGEKISDFEYDFENNFLKTNGDGIEFILIQKGKKNFRIISK